MTSQLEVPRELHGFVCSPSTLLQLDDQWWVAGAKNVSLAAGERSHLAALFHSADGGSEWSRVSLALVWWQRCLPRGMFSWPPEAIDSVRMVKGLLTIEFWDPWIFDGGWQWRATCGTRGRWAMTKLGQVGD